MWWRIRIVGVSISKRMEPLRYGVTVIEERMDSQGNGVLCSISVYRAGQFDCCLCRLREPEPLLIYLLSSPLAT